LWLQDEDDLCRSSRQFKLVRESLCNPLADHDNGLGGRFLDARADVGPTAAQDIVVRVAVGRCPPGSYSATMLVSSSQTPRSFNLLSKSLFALMRSPNDRLRLFKYGANDSGVGSATQLESSFQY